MISDNCQRACLTLTEREWNIYDFYLICAVRDDTAVDFVKNGSYKMVILSLIASSSHSGRYRL